MDMETIAPLWLWATFGGIVLVSLFIDFVVLKKQGSHDIGVKEALNWSLVWVALSFLFNGLFWWAVKDSTGSTEMANTKSLEFLTGYLIEKSLAVDNIFVFLMIFTYFSVPEEQKQRVLVIGIIAAIVLRAILIFAGAFLLAKFHWILYVFGAFLLLTGVPPEPGVEGQRQHHPADAPPGRFLERDLVRATVAHQHQVHQQRDHDHAGEHQPKERGTNRLHCTLHRGNRRTRPCRAHGRRARFAVRRRSHSQAPGLPRCRDPGIRNDDGRARSYSPSWATIPELR